MKSIYNAFYRTTDFKYSPETYCYF